MSIDNIIGTRDQRITDASFPQTALWLLEDTDQQTVIFIVLREKFCERHVPKVDGE